MTTVGLMAVHGAPDGSYAIGVWPAGLATALLLAVPRPATAIVLAVVFASAFGSIATDRPASVAVGLALGITLETWVVWRFLTGGERIRPPLRTDVGASVATSAARCSVRSVLAWSRPARAW